MQGRSNLDNVEIAYARQVINLNTVKSSIFMINDKTYAMDTTKVKKSSDLFISKLNCCPLKSLKFLDLQIRYTLAQLVVCSICI